MSSEQHIVNCKALQEHQTDMIEFANQVSDAMGPQHDLGERVRRAQWVVELMGQRALVEATLALVEATREQTAQFQAQHERVWGIES